MVEGFTGHFLRFRRMCQVLAKALVSLHHVRRVVLLQYSGFRVYAKNAEIFGFWI